MTSIVFFQLECADTEADAPLEVAHLTAAVEPSARPARLVDERGLLVVHSVDVLTKRPMVRASCTRCAAAQAPLDLPDCGAA